jgi:hypothetical protein
MVKRIWMGVLACVLILGYSTCSRSAAEPSAAEVQEFLERFSSSSLGWRVSADDSAIEVEPLRGESGRFVIVLNNPKCTFNTGVYQEMDAKIPAIELPMEMEEMVLIYGPEENFCAMRSASGVEFTIDVTQFIPESKRAEIEEKEGGSIPEISYRVGRIESNDYDMSLLLAQDERGFQETVMGMMAANPDIKATMTDFEIEVPLHEGENKFNLRLDKLVSGIAVHPDLMALFLRTGDSGTIISSLFEQKDPFIKVDSKMEGFSLSISTEDTDVLFQLEGIALGYSAVPIPGGSTFRFGFDWDFQGLRSEGLKEKDVAALTQVNRMNLELSVEGLPSEFLDAYLKLLNAAQTFQTEKDPSELEGLQMQAMGLAGHIMQAKPVITLKVSPLDHAYGRLEADASFQVVGMRSPVGKATVTVSDVNALSEALERDQILPAEQLGAFMEWLGKMFQVDDSGRGTLTFEIKEEDPSNFYLNGKPQKFE